VTTAEVTVAGTDLLGWYEQMAVIRRTEKAAQDLFLAGLIKGTTHLAAGQEAPSRVLERLRRDER
jgi:pyruvate dehydrogenase E1 component alpha subunit